MGISKRYRINKPHVINETIDGEAVIVDLESGNYFSLEYSGADIWDMIEGGYSIPEIVEALGSRYTGDPEAIRQAVDQLTGRLVDEKLIVPLAEDQASGDTKVQVVKEGAQTPFAAPVLQKYDDMQELLLLDPIHDVDEAGWPEKAPDSKGN